jgi:acetylornithine deacetylase/succinyl-diaminopimelate desuccinylase-like protein
VVSPPSGPLDAVGQRLTSRWHTDLPAVIGEFVRIPSISPAFDAGWAERGALEAAVALAARWLSDHLPDATIRRLSLPLRTPLLLCDIPASPGADGRKPGTTGGPVLVYGHLDKQPAGGSWTRTQPFEPLRTDGALYGRGAADDGYAPFLSGAVIEELRRAGVAHPRVILLLETSEESSSVDLPFYLDGYSELLGNPSLVICLDGFVPDHERLWATVSMRGILVGDLQVSLLEEGVHSGIAGGVVASSFRVLRELLDRAEDATSGAVLLPEFNVAVPAEHRRILARQAEVAAAPVEHVRLLPGVTPVHADRLAQLTAQCWEPSVGYVGLDGAPSVHEAGSVLRPSTTVRLSVRLPPTADQKAAARALSCALTSAPPYGAHAEFRLVAAERGWLSLLAAERRELLETASQRGYRQSAGLCGGAATIPFLGMFASRYPEVAILPVGVLGPGSNPHSPDERLDLPAARNLSVAVASLLADLTDQAG